MTRYRVGQIVEVTEPGLARPVGYRFTVTKAVALEDRDYGKAYYEGDGFRSGVWENFLRPVRLSPGSATTDPKQEGI